MTILRNLVIFSLFSCSLLAASDEGLSSSSPSKVSKLGKKVERVLSKKNIKKCEKEISSAFTQEEEAKMLSEIYYSDLSDKQKELLFMASEVIQEARGQE